MTVLNARRILIIHNDSFQLIDTITTLEIMMSLLGVPIIIHVYNIILDINKNFKF